MNIRVADKRLERLSNVVIFLATFLFCVAYYSFNPHLLGSTNGNRVSKEEDISHGWTTEDGISVDLNNLNDLPGFVENGAVVKRKLPDDIEPGAELNFLSRNVTLQLYYDDVLVFSYDNATVDNGALFGAHFNFAPLTPENVGQTAALKLSPVYPEDACQINDVFISGTMSYIQRYVRAHGLALMMSLIIAFIGLVIIVLHLNLFRSGESELDLLSLGAISILMGVWSGAETLIPQLITGLNGIIIALDYMALLFVPYPIIRFMGSLLMPKHRNVFDTAARVFQVLAVGITVFLAAAMRFDLHQLHVICHIQLILCALIIICEVVEGFTQNGHSLLRGVREANRSILVAFLIFVLCSIVDFIIFNANKRGVSDSAFFMRMGLFVLSIVLAVHAFRTSSGLMRRAEHADAVEAIAYMDSLTNLGNRTAWKMMRDEMDDAIADGSVTDAMVCQFDVNFLKRVNDSMGHASGDRYLKQVADSISRSFGTEGACYRTGGDEFTALLVGINLPERLEICTKLLRDSLEEQDAMGEGEGLVPMTQSIAMGHAFVSETNNHRIKGAKDLADKRMYVNKRAMKAERVD